MTRSVKTVERFFFEPAATSTLALVRAWFGVVVFIWTLSLIADLDAFFARDGLVPKQPGGPGIWGLLGWVPSFGAVVVIFVVLLCASLALAVGWQARCAAVLVWVGLMSFERRNPFVFNAGDGLLRVIAFYLMFASAGAALSVDRLRKQREEFWASPVRAPWALRLLQLQLTIVYLASVWDKVRGSTWTHGTAMSYVLRVNDLAALPVPGFMSHTVIVVKLLTYGTLAAELGLGLFIWVPRLRPYVIAVGILFHLAIMWQIRVGFFSLAMIALYLAFLDPATASRLALRIRDATQSRAGTECPWPLGLPARGG